jgi:hypothetical protein
VKLSPQQVESTLIPITPTDYTNGTRLLKEFQPRARLAAMSRCLTDRGYADGGAETLALYRPTHGQLQYFEDPDGLRRDGFGVVKDSQPAPSSDGTRPSAKTRAVPADVTRSCEQVAEDVVAPLAQPVSVFYDWTKEVENIDTSDAMKPAWQAWSACMADKGYNVATESQFFGMANQAIGNSLQKELVLATAYADCLESNVIPVRTDLRTEAKTTYASANAAQVEAAERDLPAAIDKISRATGVSYPG